MEGGGQPEGAGGGGNVNQIRQIGGREVMDSFKGMEEDFESGSIFDREPVKLLENGGDVMKGGGSGDDAGC